MILKTKEEIKMICQNCGNTVNDNSTFCPVCGTQQTQINYSNKKNSGSKSLLIVIMVLLIAIIVALTVIIVKPDPLSPPEPTPSAEPTTIPTISPEPTKDTNTQIVIVKPDNPPVVPPAQPQNTSVISTMFVVNCDEWISLRSTPSTSASRIATIPYGASVGYIEPASNGFYKISYNGKIGYALSQYLSNYQPSAKAASAPQKTSTYYRVVNCHEWISLRSTPSTSAPKLAEIPLGATVQFISTASNGFYKVSYNGQVGYALASYLG